MDLNDHWNYLLAGSHGPGAVGMRRQKQQDAMCEGMVWLCIAILYVLLMGAEWDPKTAVTTLKWLSFSLFGIAVICLVAMMVNSGRISREEERDEWSKR